MKCTAHDLEVMIRTPVKLNLGYVALLYKLFFSEKKRQNKIMEIAILKSVNITLVSQQAGKIHLSAV